MVASSPSMLELEPLGQEQTVTLREVSDIDELLAEAVRGFPVLYNKSLDEFKNNSMKTNAWKKVLEMVPGISSRRRSVLSF